MRLWLILSGLNGFVAIAAGAFGAHGLQSIADSAQLSAFETGANYHLLHAMALLGVAALGHLAPSSGGIRAAGWLFVTGIILFAGPLYLYGTMGSKALIMVTPVGGLTLMVGWSLLAIAGFKLKGHQG
ncbi:MAG: DUF423 domain-containing protein [Alphaproteobacteria bacterium]